MVSLARASCEELGVVSLSTNALSIPMWSHYADFHRGFVLEFLVPDETIFTPPEGRLESAKYLHDRLFSHPIVYAVDRPALLLGIDTMHDVVDKMLLTKSIDWEYEDEVRVIVNYRPPGIYRYERDEVLCSVIAGMKMNESDYKRLETIVSGLADNISGLKLYQAQAMDSEYKLQVPGHPRLG